MSPKARTAADDDTQGVRERILAAAMAILHEAGIQGLSQVQVARRAKVRQSHLTYYFPKRNDLAEAVAARFVDGIVRELQRTAAGSAAGGPGAMLQRVADAIADQGHMRMFTAVIVEADGDPELRSILVRGARRLQSTLAGLLGGEHAMERAELVLASLWGLGLYDFVVREKRRSAPRASFLASLAGVASGVETSAASPGDRAGVRGRRRPGR